MKHFKIFGQAMLLLAMLGYHTQAQAGDVAIGAKVSTLGLGVEATVNVVPLLANVRLQGNYFTYNTTSTPGSPVGGTPVSYDASLDFKSVGLLADIYPFAGKFHITGGAYYNGNKGTLVSKAGVVVIGNTIYTNPVVRSTIDFNKFSPYIGIGWGDAVSDGSPLGFNFEVGALYQGSPQIALSSPTVSAADLAIEKKRLDDAVNKYTWYPVASLGISWKF